MAIQTGHQNHKNHESTLYMKKSNLLLIPAIAMLGSTFCSAAVYNVKYLGGLAPIATSSLQGVLGTTGESWNQATGNFANLIDSTGVSSTIGVSGLSGGQNEGPLNTIFYGNSNQFSKGANQTISISGLTIAGVYNIYIYALSHNAGSWGTTSVERAAGAFTTTNTTGNGSSQSLDNGITGTNGTTFTAGSNYVLFQSIVADGSGNISIVADALDAGAASTRLHVNGLQIAAIPEPSAALLGGLGVLALLRRRRA
jgi:hypothetical protein